MSKLPDRFLTRRGLVVMALSAYVDADDDVGIPARTFLARYSPSVDSGTELFHLV